MLVTPENDSRLRKTSASPIAGTAFTSVWVTARAPTATSRSNICRANSRESAPARSASTVSGANLTAERASRSSTVSPRRGTTTVLSRSAYPSNCATIRTEPPAASGGPGTTPMLSVNWLSPRPGNETKTSTRGVLEEASNVCTVQAVPSMGFWATQPSGAPASQRLDAATENTVATGNWPMAELRTRASIVGRSGLQGKGHKCEIPARHCSHPNTQCPYPTNHRKTRHPHKLQARTAR